MENAGGDLHIHTIYSDGTLSPEKIFELAEKQGLKAISITDHDSAEAYYTDFLTVRPEPFSFELIPGVELSADHKKENNSIVEVHVLGYGLDVFHEKMKAYFQEYQAMRYQRALTMLEKLNKMGVAITLKDLEQQVKKNIYGRLHMANTIIEKGFARNLKEVFQCYIGYDCPAYVAKEQKDLASLTCLIRECGGIPVIAHPGPQGLEKEIPRMKECGIAGIEVFHPEHSPSMRTKLLDQAKELSMLVTGGSDFHGSSKKDQPLGAATLPFQYIKQLKETIENESIFKQ